MAWTLGITGMDRQLEADVIAAFKVANSELGGRWTLVESEQADFVIVDMDSLYGPISWLRLHGLGRKVIGLTSVDRPQTDYRLPHPITASDLAVLLSEIEIDAALKAAAEPPHTPAPTAAADDTQGAAGSAPEAATQTRDATIDTAADDASPAESLAAPDSAPEPQAPIPAPTVPEFPVLPVPAIPAHTPPAPTQASARPLAEWLAVGLPAGRVRLSHPEAPPLLLDVRQGLWYGSSRLKPLVPHFTRPLQATDFEPMEATDWDAQSARLGPPQPLQRLRWLGGLLSGTPVTGVYLLQKWPQIEREYPRHFRIATAMSKGPADVDAIAQSAGVSHEDVSEFINAHLASGHVVPAPATPTPPSETGRTGGLLGRLRG